MVKTTNRRTLVSRPAVLLAVLMMALVPISGIGSADPVDDAVKTVTDVVCEAEEGVADLLCPEWAGIEAWVARYDGPGNDFDFAEDLVVSPDGFRVFATGFSTSADTGFNYATVAYDAISGEELWAARYDGPKSGRDTAQALSVSPDGTKVYVTGDSEGEGTDRDYATLAYDAADGSELWVARHNGPANGQDDARALDVSPDGSFVHVTGSSLADGTSSDYATVAYDAATGDQVWIARYDGPKSGPDNAHAIRVSPDGASVYVTGESGASVCRDYATVAYDATTGAELWASRYDGSDNDCDIATELGMSPDGSSVFVTGYTLGAATWWDYATVAYSAATGVQLWESRYNGPSDDIDIPRSLAVSPDGTQVFVTGYSWSLSTGYDYATLAYNALTGTQIWIARYDGSEDSGLISGRDNAHALAVSPDGSRVFVAGYSYTGTNTDYATVGYGAADGSKLGSAQYTGPGIGFDNSRAVGMSPDGSRVFVTGGSDGGTDTDFDFATVAYVNELVPTP